MINPSAKRVAIIDLAQSICEIKSFEDLNRYIGGVGIGIKLFQMYAENDPVIFAIGPLNGLYPYASKTAVVLNNSGVVEDLYLGGSLSTRIKFAGLDAIVLLNQSETPKYLDIKSTGTHFLDTSEDIDTIGLPGRRSVITTDETRVLLDNYFTTREQFLFKKLREKQVKGLVVTGNEIWNLVNDEKYKKLYSMLLARRNELSVSPAYFPSCSGCPMGCEKSQIGEVGGNILLHSLVACTFAGNIYTDLGLIFSCLNTAGYEYTHEDIENLPMLIEETFRELTHI